MNELTPDLSLPPLEAEGETPIRFCEGCGRRLVPTASRGCCDLHFPDGEQQRAAAVGPPAWQTIEPATGRVMLTLSKSFSGVAREWDLLCAIPWTKQQLWEHCHLMHAGVSKALVDLRHAGHPVHRVVNSRLAALRMAG